jgi:hypothetical protein
MVYNSRAFGIIFAAWLVALVPIGILWIAGAQVTEARVFGIVGVLIALFDLGGRWTSTEVTGLSRFFRSDSGGSITFMPAWFVGLALVFLVSMR